MMNEVGVVKAAKKPLLLPRWLKFLLMLLGFLVGVAALLWVIADISTRDALEAELAQIRSRGWPTALDELHSEPIAASENAGVLYEQVGSLMVGLSGAEWELLDRLADSETPGSLASDELAKLESTLLRRAPVLQLLRQARDRPQCQFDIKLSDGLGLHVNYLRKYNLRGAVRCLNHAMLLAAEKGNTEEVLEYWLDSVAILRAQQGHKVLIIEMTRQACTAMLMYRLEQILRKHIFDEAQLQAVLKSLDGREAHDSFAQGMWGQVPVARGTFQQSLEELGPLSGWDPTGQFQGPRSSRRARWANAVVAGVDRLWRSGLARPFRQYNEARTIRFVAEVARLSEKPYHQVHNQLAQLDTQLTQMPFYAALAKVLCGGYGGVTRSVTWQAHREADLRCARVAVAVEIYRARAERYPDSLSELTPDILPTIPMDPFTGKPLLYVNDGSRVVVYSVGEGLQDDGGSEEGPSYRPKDIVFTLRRAPEPTEEPDDE